MTDNEIDLTEVKGIGPATAVKLHGAGIRSAEALARSQVEHLVQIVGRATATKIIENARTLLDEMGIDYKKEGKAPEEDLEEVETAEKAEIEEELEEVEAEVIEGDLTEVKGIGPKTQQELIAAGFNTVERLANAETKELMKIDGVGKATAEKFKQSAQDVLGVEEEFEEQLDEIQDEDLEEVEEAIVDEDEPEEFEKDDVLYDGDVRTEHERSPAPQGIPTKKKRGVQISSQADKIDIDELDAEEADAKSGWQVKAKELTEEEREARRLRQEMLRAQERITRDIPTPPQPVKAKKEDTKEKHEKPVKKAKKSKKIQQQVKKTREQKKAERFVDYYSNTDIHSKEKVGRPKVSGKTSGESQPRIELERDTYLGKITSKRRSRRNVNNRQVIVNLDNGFEPDQLVGQKVYFQYPDDEDRKVSGSISKRFGKKSSGKVLVIFKKGVREEAIFQKVYKY